MKIETIAGFQSFEELQNSITMQSESITRMESSEIKDYDLGTWIVSLGIRIRGMRVLMDLAEKYMHQMEQRLSDDSI